MIPKKEIRTVKLAMPPDILNQGKNTSGDQGEICNNCGGYGFTMSIEGGKLDCKECGSTGVRTLTLEEVNKKLNMVIQDLTGLRKALISTLDSQGIHLIPKVEENKNG